MISTLFLFSYLRAHLFSVLSQFANAFTGPCTYNREHLVVRPVQSVCIFI